MSPLPRIHTATPTATSRTALLDSASTGSGSGSTKSVFADVMRAVFNPAPAPHAAAHSAQIRPHSDPEKNSSNAEVNPSSSLSPAATQQVPSGNSNTLAQVTDGVGAETEGSSASATGGKPVGSTSGSVDAQGQSVSLAQAADKSTAAAKCSLDNSANSGSSKTGIQRKEVQAANDSTLGGTANATVTVPIAVSGAPSIPLEPRVLGSNADTTSKPASTDNAQKNVPASNSTASSVLQPRNLLVKDAKSNDGMFQGEMLRTATSLNSKVDTKAGETLLEGSSNPVLSPEKNGKQTATIAAGNYRNTTNPSSQSGNQDPAAATFSFDGSPTTASTETASSSTSGAANDTANGVASLTANIPSSNATAAGNENASSSNSGAITPNANGNSPSPRNASSSNPSTGIVSSSAPAGQNGAGSHALTAFSQAEVPHGNAVPSVGLHGGSSLVSAPDAAGPTGNPGLAHALPSASHRTISDAFTALDSGAATDHGVLLRAAPHQVAVGITDPALGWVEVRAERVGGQITAALTADSTASHAALTSVMPSMATYLQDHHAGVQHVHVETGLTGGRAGTGSQGQPSSQGDARGAESVAIPIGGGTSWGAVATIADQAPHPSTTRSMNEGHQVSIRA
jgi:hypothetical protein